MGEALEGRGIWRVISEIAEHMVGGRGRKTEEKERDEFGEASNPVSLSKGFGGAVGSQSEKIC